MLLTLTLALSFAAPQGTLTVDAGRGPITVYLPSGYDPSEPAPLIVLLHGYGASGATQESYMRFRPLQDQYGFLYCTPDGTTNGVGARFWNATNACCDFQNSGVDDSGYLRALIEAIEVAAAVDPRSIHLIGHSNGGFMSYRMACDNSDKIASIASLAGATHINPAACGAGEPVHVLQIHGTADTTIRYGGGSILGASYPGAVATVQQWALRNGCGTSTVVTQGALNLDAGIAGNETTVTQFTDDCDPGGSVELWTINGGSHTPNLTASFRNSVVQHLLARPKPGVDATIYCSPAALNSSGAAARISASGSSVLVDNDLTLTADDLPQSTFGYFLTSQTADLQMPPGSQGSLCLGGSIGRFSATVQSSGPLGSFSMPIDLTALPGNPPTSAASGETWNFQAWFRDANPGSTSNLTDAVSVLVR